MPGGDGVPQSSALGPLLFLLHVEDIPHILEKNEMFPDDVKIWTIIRSVIDSSL